MLRHLLMWAVEGLGIVILVVMIVGGWVVWETSRATGGRWGRR